MAYTVSKPKVQTTVASQQHSSGPEAFNDASAAAHGINTANPQQMASTSCGNANQRLAEG